MIQEAKNDKLEELQFFLPIRTIFGRLFFSFAIYENDKIENKPLSWRKIGL
jgi:hypothetical protein